MRTFSLFCCLVIITKAPDKIINDIGEKIIRIFYVVIDTVCKSASINTSTIKNFLHTADEALSVQNMY
jgi:hypothetical protein